MALYDYLRSAVKNATQNTGLGTIGSALGSTISPVVGSTVGKIAGNAASSYLNNITPQAISNNGYFNSTAGTTPTITTPTYQTVNVPEPDYIDWDTAYAQALQRVNPTYDIMRGRTEKQYKEQREQTPQMLAAKYGGMAGLRGGRAESASAELTQEEAQAMNELESNRQQALNAAASDIQNQDYTQQYQTWLAKQQAATQAADQKWEQDKLAYNASMARTNADNENYWKYLNYLTGREDAATKSDQWNKEFTEGQRQFDVTGEQKQYYWDAEQAAKQAAQASRATGYAGNGKTATTPSTGYKTANDAQQWINANNVNFNSPAEMYNYLISAMQNGEVNYTWGNTIINTLKNMFPGTI